MHVHEKKYSTDSMMSLEEIVKQAKEIGLDGVCITDHDSNEIMEEAHQLKKNTGFLILVGVEILTYEGDLIVFGLKELPKHMMHASDLLDLITEKGGVGISAHPYRQNNRGMEDFIKKLPKLAGVEGFNGNTSMENNLKAYQAATEMGIPIFGSSDAHQVDRIGKYATWFPEGIRDEKDLIEAIKDKNVKPVMCKNGVFKNISKQLVSI